MKKITPGSRFLSAFRGEMRSNIIEFGKRLWDSDGDVFVFMARKATCFFECLRELKIADVRGIAVSDRILDMDLDLFDGKKVILVDDCVFTGTTLFNTKRQIENNGAIKCTTLALSINRDWLRPSLLPGGYECKDLEFEGPVLQLDDSQSVQQCYDIVRAISIFPRPYDVDYPHTVTSKISEQAFDCLLKSPGWTAHDVSSVFQKQHDVRAYTLIPENDVVISAFKKTKGLYNLIDCAKVRLYARKLSGDAWSIRMVPIVMLGAVERTYPHFSFGAGIFWDDISKLGFSSLRSIYRLFHFLASRLLLEKFVQNAKERNGICVSHEIRRDVVEMAFGKPCANKMDDIFCNWLNIKSPSRANEQECIALKGFTDEVVEVDNFTSLMHQCVTPFVWLYKELELPARTLVKEYGLGVCMEKHAQNIVRLGKGFSFKKLVSRLVYNDVDVAKYISLFLDRAIDLGIVVPTIVEENGNIYRAFRHGEDAVFGEAQERLCVLALQAYMEKKGDNYLFGLELQKIIVLFIQIALRDGNLLERLNTSESVDVGCRVVSVKGHLHGPVPTITSVDSSGSVGAPFVEGKERHIKWLLEEWVKDGILKKEKPGDLPLAVGNFRDMSGFIRALSGEERETGNYLLGNFSKELRAFVLNGKGELETYSAILIDELNHILRSVDFTQVDIFRRANIGTQTMGLISRKKTIGINYSINRRIIEDIYRRYFVKPVVGTKYSIKKVPSLPIGGKKESVARIIGRCLGSMVGDKGKPLNNDKDLVLLTVCSEPEYLIRALSGELAIISERWVKTMAQIRSLAQKDDFALASDLLVSLNDLFVAANSGCMKYMWFKDSRFQEVVSRVDKYAREADASGQLRDQWSLLWSDAPLNEIMAMSHDIKTHVDNIGYWLFMFNLTLLLYNCWLVAKAEKMHQTPKKKPSNARNDCLKWDGLFKKYFEKNFLLSLLCDFEEKILLSIIDDESLLRNLCAEMSLFIENGRKSAVRPLLDASEIYCDNHGLHGELRSFSYAAFIDIEPTERGEGEFYDGYDVYSKFLPKDCRLLDKIHNPWRVGKWILFRGGRNSEVPADFLWKVSDFCDNTKLKYRAVLFGQLAYDDCVRDMAGSINLAPGNFFLRIASLRAAVLSASHDSSVVVVSEVDHAVDPEYEKFLHVSKFYLTDKRRFESSSDELIKRNYDIGIFVKNKDKSPSIKDERMHEPAKNYFGCIDACIITIRDDEYDAVLHFFGEGKVVSGANFFYHVCSVGVRDATNVNVAVVRNSLQGESGAQNVAHNIISELAPKWIIVVGIGGAFPNHEYTLGDVLLSQRYQDFSVNAAIQDKASEFHDNGGPMAPAVEKLLNGLRGMKGLLGDWHSKKNIELNRPKVKIPRNTNSPTLYGDESWKEKVIGNLKKFFCNEACRCDPDFFSVPLVSSNTLIKDADLAQQLSLHARQAGGVEMELAGVMQAARHAQYPINVFTIRGVSDLIGLKRDSAWTTYACRSAASFAKAIISSGLIRNSGGDTMPLTGVKNRP